MAIIKSHISKLITFENKEPISIFWSLTTQKWYLRKNVIPRIKTSPNNIIFTERGQISEPYIYYKFSTCLNYISDVNRLELSHCNKCKFVNDHIKTSFIYYLGNGEKICIPLLPNFDKTKVFFTLAGVDYKPAMILRVEK